MMIGRILHALSFERAYKVTVMLGAAISAVSCVALAVMLAPARTTTTPNLAEAAPTELRWTAAPVPVAPEARARRGARTEADQPDAEQPAQAAGRALQPLPPPEPARAEPARAEAAPPPAPPAAAEPERVEAEPPAAPAAVYVSPEVIDGGTLWVDGRFVRLAGIEALDAQDVCERGRRRVWRCGQQARAALRNLVRGQRVECRPAGGSADATLARCTVAGKDLSAALVAQRLAIPLEDASAQRDAPPPFRPFR